MFNRRAAAPAYSGSNADVVRFELPALPRSLAAATRQQLVDSYWRLHPRFVFFKGVPPNASLLDVGAGSGGLAFWREHLDPQRTDISLYGIDLNVPITRNLYADFAIANLDEGLPFADRTFDAVFASHILEHVKDPAEVIAGLAARLRVGGRAYIEMPTPASKALPSAQTYRDRGWPMMISNFHDDATHRDTFPLAELIETAGRAGLSCVESGVVSSPHLEDALIARGYAWRDEELLLYGYWSKTRWAQYAIFERVPAAEIETGPYAPEIEGIAPEMRNGRSVRDGYARGWGLEFGSLAAQVAADPLYREAAALTVGRSCLDEARRMNLFLLIKFCLDGIPRGNIVEFGAYKGGNAIFMAHVANRVRPGTQVYALDTFRGMPTTDKAVDAHAAGDFGDVDLEALRAFVAEHRIENLHLVQGRFEDTARDVIAHSAPFALAHIDCDIRSAVAYAYDVVRPAMVPGGYVVFDDATVSSCIGATEAVEDLVIRRDGLSSEQIYPHFVFRMGGASSD